ncbi:hypothetical protein RRF57_010722 [Xylaria bambusicola]|uniref:Uncharacterized protein n=1 Tax=Xylaria bambusicola TaxID=326684 RepID=A0AAN7ULN9_9PEZI
MDHGLHEFRHGLSPAADRLGIELELFPGPLVDLQDLGSALLDLFFACFFCFHGDDLDAIFRSSQGLC